LESFRVKSGAVWPGSVSAWILFVKGERRKPNAIKEGMIFILMMLARRVGASR
jgi:hypothetical protein